MSSPEVSSAADLANVSLPEGYMLAITADGATLYRPDGAVLHHYGRAYSARIIEGDAAEDALDFEEACRQLGEMFEGGACG